MRHIFGLSDCGHNAAGHPAVQETPSPTPGPVTRYAALALVFLAAPALAQSRPDVPRAAADAAISYLRTEATTLGFGDATGFVAVDGASLTVGQVDAVGTFWIHLIPETLSRTSLGVRALGDSVNIELDSRTVAIVDTVERVLHAKGLS